MATAVPVVKAGARRPGALIFALLFTLESVARATIATVVPLAALAALGSSRAVSVAQVGVGIVGLCASFMVPLLLHRVRRRWVYSLGTLAIVATSAALAFATPATLIMGMMLRVFGTACLNITLNLYIMDYIHRRELIRSEPMRLTMSAVIWTTCPALGVWLTTRVAPEAALMLSAGAALVLLVVFWGLRLADSPAVARAGRPAPLPWKHIGRFVSQPRLRLGWLIAFGRSAWWAQFFTYGPLYMVTSGKGGMAGALLISLGQATLFLNIVVGRMAVRLGLGRVIGWAFLATAACSLAAGLASANPWLTAGFLLLGSFCCSALDAVGNVPFLRSVHAHERAEMATVFRSYLDFSDLLPPVVFAVLLGFFGLESVFITSALWMLVIGITARRWLPAGM